MCTGSEQVQMAPLSTSGTAREQIDSSKKGLIAIFSSQLFVLSLELSSDGKRTCSAQELKMLLAIFTFHDCDAGSIRVDGTTFTHSI